ncbi:MAG: phenylacetate--CoA ligase family protein [Anaerolineales bacterium]|nr:phenylacetate--CoA ligase family protein [Anaerolineales bacterium]
MKDAHIRKIYRRMTSERGRRWLQAYQDRLLRQAVQHAATNSPFYQEKFKEHGVKPETIRQASDLTRLGFFTHPLDLQQDPFQFLAVPRQQILYAMASSGTTGKPKTIFLTPRDWMIGSRTIGNAMSLMGIQAQDVAQIVFSFGTPAWMTGSVLQAGLERVGAFVLPTGNSIAIQKQFETIQTFGSTILMGTPSYLHRLTVEEQKLADLHALGIRLIRLGAEPWSETFRQYLEESWGAEVYDSYGMMELGAVGAAECKAHDGLHLSPYLIVEVIDPDSGENLPRGELGELVFTTVQREASPLLRYRSGDLGALLPAEICSCAELPTNRISRIQGRTDDMLFLGSGENVFPNQLEAPLIGINGLTGFQIIIDKHQYQDHLRLRIETHNPSYEFEQQLIQSFNQALPFLEHEIYQSKMVAPLEIEFLNPGTLQQESPIKVRRIIDRRPA